MAFVTSAALPSRSSWAPNTSTVSFHPRPVIPFRPNNRSARLHMCIPSPPASTKTTVESFIRAASDLGTIRFIAIANGAVLETIGRFDYSISNFSVPNKGDYITIKNVDKTFECHINTSKVRVITMSTQPAKIGGHDLHVIRFRGEDDALMLSCLLMWDPSLGQGHYLHGALDAFNKLKERFGERVEL